MSETGWSREATMLLITTRGDMETDFNSGKKHAKLWDQVAKNMQDVGNYNLTGKQCHEKWRNLIKTYNNNKDKSNKTGAAPIKWEFFTALDDVRGLKDCSEPPPQQTVNSPLPLTLPQAKRTRICDVQAGSSTGSDITTSNSTQPKSDSPNMPSTKAGGSHVSGDITAKGVGKILRKNALARRHISEQEGPPLWFKNCMDELMGGNKRREEAITKIWAEQKEIEEKKVHAMERLITALTTGK